MATPRKWPGPEGTLEDRAELAHLDPRLESRRVHLVAVRREDEVDTGIGGGRQVALLVARVGGQIGALAELGGVDEEAHHDRVAFGARGREQREVAGVQRAHRGHEADRPLAGGLELDPDLGDRARHLHATATVASARTR